MKKITALLLAALCISPFSAGAVSLSGQSAIDLEANTGFGEAGTFTGQVEVEVEGGAGGGASGNGNLQVEVMPVSEEEQAAVTTTSSGNDGIDIFIDEVEANNPGVADIRSEANGELEVEYKHQARLFWVVPVTVTSTTKVYADPEGVTRVRVTLPWWSFLVTGVGNVRSNVETAVATDPEVTEASVSADASFSARARLVEVVVASIKAAAEAEARTSAGASEGASVQ